jgi:hypothetical protein
MKNFNINICKEDTSDFVKHTINRNFLDILFDTTPGTYTYNIENIDSLKILYEELINRIINDPCCLYSNRSSVELIFVEAGINNIDNFIKNIKEMSTNLVNEIS